MSILEATNHSQALMEAMDMEQDDLSDVCGYQISL